MTKFVKFILFFFFPLIISFFSGKTFSSQSLWEYCAFTDSCEPCCYKDSEESSSKKKNSRLPSIETTGGFIFKSKDQDYWVKLGGRLHLDTVQFIGDAKDKGFEFPNGSNIRRLHFEFSGGLGPDWDYEIHAERRDKQNFFLSEAWLRYKVSDCLRLIFGQTKPLATLEYWSSDNNYIFLEPSLKTSSFFTLMLDRALGILAEIKINDDLRTHVMIYQPRQENDNFGNLYVSDKWGESFRIFYAPFHDNCDVLHLEFFARHQALGLELFGFSPLFPNLFNTLPEAIGRDDVPVINTGHVSAKSFEHYALAFLRIEGSTTLMAEYSLVPVHRTKRFQNDFSTLIFQGGFVQAAYVITGEHRNYEIEEGKLASVTPCSCWGAWEIAFRLSNVNLTDKNVYGGREHNFTTGLNWFINKYVKIAFNHIYADIRPTRVSSPGNPPLPGYEKRKLHILATRLQIAF